MENRVAITHFVNPHKFWYKSVGSQISSKAEKLLQASIDEYYKKQHEATENGHSEPNYDPATGEIVAVCDAVQQRWTRGRVVDPLNDENGRRQYRVWLLDEGIPKDVAATHVKPLAEKFANKPIRARRGLIRNVLPAHQEVSTTSVERECANAFPEWDSCLNTMLQSLIDSAEQIFFDNTTPHTVAGEVIDFGFLRFVTKQKKTVDAVSIILMVGPALHVKETSFLACFLANDAANQEYEKRASVAVVSSNDSIERGEKKPMETASMAHKVKQPLPTRPEAALPQAASSARSRTIIEKIKRLAQQHNAALPPKREEETANVEKTSTDTAAGVPQASSTSPSNVLLHPKSYMTLATSAPCRDPVVSANVLNSSLRLEQWTRAAVTNPEPKRANNVPEQREPAHHPMNSTNVILDPKSYRTLLAAQPCRDPAVSTRVLNCSRQLEQFTLGVLNPEKNSANSGPDFTSTSTNVPLTPKSDTKLAAQPCREQAVVSPQAPNCSLQQPERLSAEDPSLAQQQPRKLPNFLKRKVALMNQLQQAQASTVKESATAPATATEKETDEQTRPPTPVPGGDIAPAEGASESHLQQPQESSVAAKSSNNATQQLTVQRNTDILKFERLVKEEQCVNSGLLHHRILVHGRTVPKPIDTIAKGNFCTSVYQELEQLRISKVYRLQAYAWPHIMRGNSLVCVNSAGTGKTFAIVPAICSLAKLQIEESLVPPDAGPVAIIVCHSSREVQRVAHFCRRMLNSEANKHLPVVECYGIRKVRETCNLLFAGCAILVVTAPSYRRLYENMPEAFVRKRIRTVAIDNIEEMLGHFAADLHLLCKNCDKPELQMIVTSGSWVPMLASFLRKYKNMIACIGAYLEAAVYAKVLFQLRLRPGNGATSKQHDLAAYIKTHDYRHQRTIVFGSSSDDLAPIVEALRQHSIQHLVCPNSTVVDQHDGFGNWDRRLPGDMVVLVCLDELLSYLNVSDAQHIVHYSLPSSWSSFTRRFATSFSYYDCPYLAPATGTAQQQPKGRATTLVLLDETNNHQLPKLIDFLKIHHVQFPPQLAQTAENIRTLSEQQKVADGMAVSALCPRLLAFGDCPSNRSCIFRHSFQPVDLPGDGCPTSGTIRLKIFHVFSPVHFGARLEAHRAGGPASGWTALSDPKQFLLHDLNMQAYFANAARHQIYGGGADGKVLPNDLCALFEEQNYWRCRIIQFESNGADDCCAGDVQLKLIDTGRIVRTRSARLLCLPEQFRSLPAQAIDVRIAGIVPHDFEEHWDKHSTIFVQRWIEKHTAGSSNRHHHHADGKVVLALRDTIWIEDLLLVEQLDGLRTSVVAVKVKASLVSKEFGVPDRASFEAVRQRVRQCEESDGTTRAPSRDPPKGAACIDEPGREEMDPRKARAAEENFSTVQTGHDGGSKPTTIAAPDRAGDGHHTAVPRATVSGDRKAVDPVVPILPTEDTDTDNRTTTPLTSDTNTSDSSTSSFEVVSPQPPQTGIIARYRFETLDSGNRCKVAIGRYLAPDQFFVYRLDKMQVIQQRINAYTGASAAGTGKALTHPRVGEYCLVGFDGMYYRGQIVDVGATEMGVFFLDVGGTQMCYREELFEVPAHLLEELPFAAMEASFAFIEPKQGSSWTEEVGNAIYDDVLEQYNNAGSMEAIVIESLAPHASTNCNRYVLLLTDGHSDDPFSIVSELVQRELAMFVRRPGANDGSGPDGGIDGGPQAIWDGHGNSDDDGEEEESGSFVQLNFTHEEVQAILANITKASYGEKKEKAASDQRAITGGPSSSSSAASSLVDLALGDAKEKSQDLRKQKLRKQTSSNTTTEAPGKPEAPSSPRSGGVHLPRLECDYRFPPTIWQQDDLFVTLRVSAPEVTRYQLTVDTQSLHLQFVRDGYRYLLPLNLFGPIDPERTTHEVRGLTIVIRLARRQRSTWRWPTLLNHPGKLPWLRKAIEPGGGGGSSGSGSECSGAMDNEWSDLLPAKLDDCTMDTGSDSSQDEQDDLGLQMEDAMEEEIFLRHR